MARHDEYGVTVVAAVSRRTFARHTHEQYGFGVVEKGAQRSRSGRGMVEAGAGDIITVNPGEVHDGAPLAGEVRSWRMLYIDQPQLAALWQEISEGDGEYEFERPALTDRRARVRVCRLLRLVGGADRLPYEQNLVELLALLGTRRVKETGARAPIGIAKAMIDEHPERPWSLAVLCGACGISRFHFLRAFAKATGLTPHAYVLQKRIDAVRRLMMTGMPLSECAIAGGFSDQSHMTRVFTARYGLSPAAYSRALA